MRLPGKASCLFIFLTTILCSVVHAQQGEILVGPNVGYGIGSCSTMESKYVENPRDAENTALKMAHKRGMVGGCLVTFGLSDQFTQDEDLIAATRRRTGVARMSPAHAGANDGCLATMASNMAAALNAFSGFRLERRPLACTNWDCISGSMS